MKTLLLLRHGKSSWKDASLTDHDRPLKKRGREAAKKMGQLLREQNLQPDHMLTSTAIRASDTAVLAAKAGKFDCGLDQIAALYHAEPSAMAAIVSQVSDDFERVLVVGHNPGFEEWLAKLIGHAEEFPTAALAHLELPIKSWRELTPETKAGLKQIWRPADL